MKVGLTTFRTSTALSKNTQVLRRPVIQGNFSGNREIDFLSFCSGTLSWKLKELTFYAQKSLTLESPCPVLF
jgi:hypothetical protein